MVPAPMRFRVFQYPIPLTTGMEDMNAVLESHPGALVSHHVVVTGGTGLRIATGGGPMTATGTRASACVWSVARPFMAAGRRAFPCPGPRRDETRESPPPTEICPRRVEKAGGGAVGGPIHA